MRLTSFSLRKNNYYRKTANLLFWGMVLVVFLFLLPAVAMAETGPLENYGLEAASEFGLGSAGLVETITRIIQVILGVLGILAVLLILYAGYIWMTAGGDGAKVEKAKKVIINATIGLVIIFSAFAIVSFVISQLWGGNGESSGGPHPGGYDDLSRWGIGAGPIQSVYPAPNQRDVPINTWIAVTFKEEVVPASICNVGEVGENNKCDGDTMLNIDICKLGADNFCETGTDFSTDKFVGSTVFQTADAKTFVITPKIYLGLEDRQDREFMVTLKEGISRAADGEPILERLVSRQFTWSFFTNGELDLDPPEVLSATGGVSPAPDDSADSYSAASNPTPTVFTYQISDQTNIISEVAAAFTQPAALVVGSPSATISGNYGGSASGLVTVTIGPSGDTVSVDWPSGMQDYGGSYGGGQIVNIGPYGLTFSLASVATAGNSWQFSVTAYRAGDYIELLAGSSSVKKYLFGREIIIGATAAATTANITSAIINQSGDIFTAEGTNMVATRETGENSVRYSLKFIFSGSVPYVLEKDDGLSSTQTRTTVGRPDAYRNQLFEIEFNEPINPIAIDNIVVKYDRNSDGDFDDSEDILSDIWMEMSSDYRTIGLRGSIECGVNTCGEKIYCWPMRDGASDSGASTQYQVEISANTLMDCSDPRCAQWQGSCVGGSDNRCARDIYGKTVFYPGVNSNLSIIDGIIDLAGNSFNGSFDSYEENGKAYGLANGPKSFYDLNLSNPLFNPSNPEQGGFGDNFRWSFWVSSDIDRQAPLIKGIGPESMTGGAMTADFDQSVDISFDRLMRSATLKPGWNYGSKDDEKTRTTRYLALSTLTSGANAVGFWINKANYDENNDHWPDYTVASISHHVLDEYISYAPLAGSGIESITQNCFLPSAGPEDAGIGVCEYTGEEAKTGCVGVHLPNPASYGYLNCNEIADASVCTNPDFTCQPLYAGASEEISGSWVITRDYPSADPATGRTGCCFGKCQEQ